MSTKNEDIMLKKCGYMCTLCINVEVTVHHIDGNDRNNDLDNLTVLCWSHHVKAQHDLQITYFLTRKLTPEILKKRRDERIETFDKITQSAKIVPENEIIEQEIVNKVLQKLRESKELA